KVRPRHPGPEPTTVANDPRGWEPDYALTVISGTQEPAVKLNSVTLRDHVCLKPRLPHHRCSAQNQALGARGSPRPGPRHLSHALPSNLSARPAALPSIGGMP